MHVLICLLVVFIFVQGMLALLMGKEHFPLLNKGNRHAIS